MVHNLSGGRGILGVGRGTVPREMLPLTAGRVSVGSYDNPSARRGGPAEPRGHRGVAGHCGPGHAARSGSASPGKHFMVPPAGHPGPGAVRSAR